ncbi:YybH family protein [Flagellimonas meridianipacifica]|uniref:Ketosteroid isomerase-like protein n=1 Tax=Flagellimonas meridianipacifica TaxID=1080225 RepID=A0A2T0MAV4_9FLAO|nr:nuclear transport factor 2 family protein [Allomuricauda pacifica]PRX54623.1 ketosteroid isomerase-like protein [Allomuricauda pacifica]
MKPLLSATFVILYAYLGFSQTFQGNPKDVNQILENTKMFSEYVMTSNYDGIEASYTDDAKIFPNNTLILEGKDIIKYWTLPDGISTPYHKITQSEITVLENTAYDYGYYEGKTKRQDGQISSWKGKYVIVWKKVDDNWKMYLDIWNGVK